MKRLAALALSLAVQSWSTELTLRNVQVQVYFSPNGGCTDALVATIGQARRYVLVQAYSFTSMPLAQALKRAHDRGVDVRVILDKSQEHERYSDLAYLVRAGVPVQIDHAHPIAHNKVILIDGEIVCTGSFNLTKYAEEQNAENLLILRDPGLARIYEENWSRHAQHSGRP